MSRLIWRLKKETGEGLTLLQIFSRFVAFPGRHLSLLIHLALLYSFAKCLIVVNKIKTLKRTVCVSDECQIAEQCFFFFIRDFPLGNYKD